MPPHARRAHLSDDDFVVIAVSALDRPGHRGRDIRRERK
jgi:hypothetical protein